METFLAGQKKRSFEDQEGKEKERTEIRKANYYEKNENCTEKNCRILAAKCKNR